jgi:hypothetical protein
MRFAYRPYETSPSPADPSLTSFRPELLVRVIGTQKRAAEITVWGLLDIGAADCILPLAVADEIKPIWRGRGAMTDYARGSHPVRYGNVHFQVEIEKKRVRWPAIVAFIPDEMNIPLWGRCGFLQHFNVTFYGPDRSFVIRLRDPVPPGFTVDSIPRRKPRGSKGSDLITPSDQNP